MKLLLIFFAFLLVSTLGISQSITGKVIDSSTGEPLVYASIGVINTTVGAITDEQGNFKMDVSRLSPDSIVRFSMISYVSQNFRIEELLNKETTIKLVSAPLQLAEVVVKPSGKLKKIGADSYDKKNSSCGWGGSHFGKGNEIGLKLELGNSYVQLKTFHIRIHRQAFDSSLYRLHIRSIENNIPFKELLTENIFIKLSNESGWAEIDLSRHGIVLKGDVALSIEWVNVFGVNKNRVMKINNEPWTEYVLFNRKKERGYTYIRWGTEAKWNVVDGCPSIYLTVRD